MLAGELYDALDPDLVAERYKARDLCQKLNVSSDADEELRRTLCKQIFGKGGDTVCMQPPFYCDYGSNIELGESKEALYNSSSAFSEWRSPQLIASTLWSVWTPSGV